METSGARPQINADDADQGLTRKEENWIQYLAALDLNPRHLRLSAANSFVQFHERWIPSR